LRRYGCGCGAQEGTTYNSYIIRGADKVALVDASHEKFRQLYLDTLKGEIDPSTIDYIIVSHTEPDHSGLVGAVLVRLSRSLPSASPGKQWK
jgi:flavorubredoxin